VNMRVELTRKAVRQLERLGEPLKGRIVRALKKLGNEPPQGDIKKWKDGTDTGFCSTSASMPFMFII